MNTPKSVYSSKYLRHFTPALHRYEKRYRITREQRALNREWHYNELSKKLEQEYFDMASKAKDAPKGNGFGDSVFAQLQLSLEDKPLFRAWMDENQNDYERYFDNAIRSDWKISTRYVADQDSVICTFTMMDAANINHHVVCSSWSDDIFEAFFLTYYKVFVMYDGKRLPTEATTGRWG